LFQQGAFVNYPKKWFTKIPNAIPPKMMRGEEIFENWSRAYVPRMKKMFNPFASNGSKSK
jgi:ribose 1,5-bisphosphokinase PhnN